jgi:hypothetical protein
MKRPGMSFLTLNVLTLLLMAQTAGSCQTVTPSQKVSGWEHMTVQEFDFKNAALSEDFVIFSSQRRQIKIVCNAINLSLEIREGRVREQFVAKDFYSAGCKSLLTKLSSYGVAKGDPIDLRFSGEKTFPGLILRFQGEELIYIPAGTGETGVFLKTTPSPVSQM